MPESPHDLIARQVRRVRRRLYFTRLLKGVFLGWTIAFLAAALYLAGRTLIWGPASDLHAWITLGSAFTVGILFGIGVAWLHSPSLAGSALALDSKFELKERVTTLLTLPAAQTSSPAGLALLEDVHDKLARLNVRERFPLRLRGSQVALPCCAAMLAVVALFFTPQLQFNTAQAAAKAKLIAGTKDAQAQLDALKKTHFQNEKEKPLSKETQKIEDEIKKLLDKQLDPKDENKVRDVVQEMRTLEDKLKERMQELKDLRHKSEELKKTLEQLDKLEKLGKKLDKEGPAKDFQDALTKGNMKKAAEELDKLQKKLDQNDLNKEQKEKLAQQLRDLKEQIDRLSEHKQERDQLQKDFEDGKISEDELQREQDRLAQQEKDQADLQELSELLDGLSKELKGSGKGLAGKLRKLKGKLEALDVDEEELERILAENEALEDARLLLLGGLCEGDCLIPGNGLNGKGRPGGKRPGGKRPVGKEPNSKTSDQRQQGDTDPNGKMRITGFTKGGNFSKIPAKEVGGAFQQAVQQSSEVIDRQRIPADAADVAKGYFQKLGGQK